MKLVPVEMTIKEKIQHLMDGEVFYTEGGVKLFYRENANRSPFRTGSGCEISKAWSLKWYKEQEWYENIPEKGVPCWVWNDIEAERQLRLVVDVRRNIDCMFKFLEDSREIYWPNARPVTKNELFDE